MLFARAIVVILLIGFIALFTGIIVIADQGEGARYWAFLDHIPFGDKLGHFCLLGIFSLLLNLALAARRAPGRLRFLMLGSLILVIGMSIEELSQLFLANRTFDGVDWLANIAGIAAGEMTVRFMFRRPAAKRRAE